MLEKKLFWIKDILSKYDIYIELNADNFPKPYEYCTLHLASVGGSSDNGSYQDQLLKNAIKDKNEQDMLGIEKHQYQLGKFNDVRDIAQLADRGVELTDEEKLKWEKSEENWDGEYLTDMGGPSTKNLENEIQETNKKIEQLQVKIANRNRADYELSDEESDKDQKSNKDQKPDKDLESDKDQEVYLDSDKDIGLDTDSELYVFIFNFDMPVFFRFLYLFYMLHGRILVIKLITKLRKKNT